MKVSKIIPKSQRVKNTTGRCISFPNELHEKIIERTANEVAGYSRFVVVAVKEKFSREENNFTSNKHHKEVCVK